MDEDTSHNRHHSFTLATFNLPDVDSVCCFVSWSDEAGRLVETWTHYVAADSFRHYHVFNSDQRSATKALCKLAKGFDFRAFMTIAKSHAISDKVRLADLQGVHLKLGRNVVGDQGCVFCDAQYLKRSDRVVNPADPVAVVDVFRWRSAAEQCTQAEIDDYDVYSLGDIHNLISSVEAGEPLFHIGGNRVLPNPNGTAFVQYLPNEDSILAYFVRHPAGMILPRCFDVEVQRYRAFMPEMRQPTFIRFRPGEIICDTLSDDTLQIIRSDLCVFLGLLNSHAGYRYVNSEPERREASPEDVDGVQVIHEPQPIRIVYVNKETTIRPQVSKTHTVPTGRTVPPHDRHYRKLTYERTWTDKSGRSRTVTCHRHVTMAKVRGGAPIDAAKPVNVVRLANPIDPGVKAA